MAQPSERRKITAKGILLPSEWDDKGSILALTFFTHDEDEYLVKGKGMMPELMAVLRQELVIEGYLKWEEGQKMLQITAFSPFGIL